MSKPDIALARFATGPGANVLVPSSGLRDTGFVSGTPAVPGYVNELLSQIYLWLVYLEQMVGVDRTLMLCGASGNGTGGRGTTGSFGSGAATSYVLGVPLEAGDRIKGFTFEVFGDGVADLTDIECLVSNSLGNTAINIGTVSVLAPAAAFATVTCDCTDTTIAAGDVVAISMNMSAAGIIVNNFAIVYDHPIP